MFKVVFDLFFPEVHLGGEVLNLDTLYIEVNERKFLRNRTAHL